MSQLNKVDVIIVGAGPVGVVSALLLSQQGVNCILLEKNKISQRMQTKSDSFDGRTLALNIESAQLLASINCLPSEDCCEQIKVIRVSQQGHLGSCLLESERDYLSYFGLSINSIDLGRQMQHRLQSECEKNAHLQFMDGVKITNMSQDNDPTDYPVCLMIEDEKSSRQINSRILIAADGTDSQIREHFHFTVQRKDYQQVATLMKVTHKKHHGNMAHERFLKQGILALLPTAIVSKNNPTLDHQSGFVSSVVWLQNNATRIDPKKLSEGELLSLLEQRFGQQYGALTACTSPIDYPMHELVAIETHKRNVVLIGNAAHSLHPVAGQGLNLGLTDAKWLVYHLLKTGCTSHSLDKFATVQQKNIATIRHFVNDLLNRFSSSHPLAALSRTLLMVGFEKSTLVRRPFLHYLSGVQASPPWFWQTLKPSEFMDNFRKEVDRSCQKVFKMGN